MPQLTVSSTEPAEVDGLPPAPAAGPRHRALQGDPEAGRSSRSRSAGTFVLHPGICPEYRNAHGCFWALANRDLDRVGMTLLRVDAGIDTGPVYLHGTCDYDEVRDSHIVIQHRAVVDNLDAIGRTLHGARARRGRCSR